MKKSMQIIIPAISLTVICLVVTVLLALTNDVTKVKINENLINEKKVIAKVVLSEATDIKQLEDIKKVSAAYVGTDNSGKIIGYVFETSAKGYAGDVIVMTGVNSDGKITGVKVLSSNETPGLGKKAESNDFLRQYNSGEYEIKVVKGNHKENEVEAITGATITSKAVTSAVNNALTVFKEIRGEQN